MAAGRPTIYTDELIENASGYLDNWEESGDAIPSQAGLAVYLGVSISCVENWGRDEGKQEFLRVLDEIESRQRSLLINRGLMGLFNSAITKLILSKHGYHEKTIQDNTSSDGTMSPKTIQIVPLSPKDE